MKKAVVYYSLEGNTKYVVDRISKTIEADVFCLAPVKPYPTNAVAKYVVGGKAASLGEAPEIRPIDFDPEKYDGIIFATPVWAGTFAPPLRTFANRYASRLAGKKLAFYAGYRGRGAENTAEKYAQLLGIDAFDSTLFLIDPLQKRTTEKDEQIDAFARGL